MLRAKRDQDAGGEREHGQRSGFAQALEHAGGFGQAAMVGQMLEPLSPERLGFHARPRLADCGVPRGLIRSRHRHGHRRIGGESENHDGRRQRAAHPGPFRALASPAGSEPAGDAGDEQEGNNLVAVAHLVVEDHDHHEQ